MHLVGVDLGQVGDPTAVSIIERLETIKVAPNVPGQMYIEPDKSISQYSLMHLEQAPIGTKYTTVVDRIKTLLAHPSLLGRAELIIDYTGVGHPVYDMMLEEELSPITINITSGAVIHPNIAGYNVPKQDIVAVLTVLLETGRFKYTSKLKLAHLFEEQMREYRVKIRRGSVGYEALTEEIHDDAVIAVALPVWYAERTMGGMRDIRSKNMEAKKKFNPLEYIGRK